jgi:hypothetical protein
MEGLRRAFGSGDVSLSDLTKICAPSRPTMAKKGFRSGCWNLVSKPIFVAVKSDGLVDVADDEER